MVNKKLLKLSYFISILFLIIFYIASILSHPFFIIPFFIVLALFIFIQHQYLSEYYRLKFSLPSIKNTHVLFNAYKRTGLFISSEQTVLLANNTMGRYWGKKIKNYHTYPLKKLFLNSSKITNIHRQIKHTLKHHTVATINTKIPLSTGTPVPVKMIVSFLDKKNHPSHLLWTIKSLESDEQNKNWRQSYRLFFQVIHALRTFSKKGTELELFQQILKIITSFYPSHIFAYAIKENITVSQTHIKDLFPKASLFYNQKTYLPFASSGPFEGSSLSSFATYSMPVQIQGKNEFVILCYSDKQHFFSSFFTSLLAKIFIEVSKTITNKREHILASQKITLYQTTLQTKIQELKKDQALLEKQDRKNQYMIHELLIARAKTEQASITKNEFLANVSHELRTPLTAIIGFAETIQTKTFGKLNNIKYEKYIDYIVKSAHHLLSLINDILDLSRVESGKQKFLGKKIDVNHIINETLQVIEQYPEIQNRIITFKPLRDDFLLKMDERSLKQILLNLLSNAIKFTQKNGKITISLTLIKDNQLDLCISDNGIGISKEKQKNLFLPFSQVENVFTRKHKGTGLGLALVKKLCDIHQAEIILQSAPKKGTKIHIIFPQSRVIFKQSEQP